MLQEEEDIDTCIQEVNKVLGPSVSSAVACPADDFAASKPILSIEHRFIWCYDDCTT